MNKFRLLHIAALSRSQVVLSNHRLLLHFMLQFAAIWPRCPQLNHLCSPYSYFAYSNFHIVSRLPFSFVFLQKLNFSTVNVGIVYLVSIATTICSYCLGGLESKMIEWWRMKYFSFTMCHNPPCMSTLLIWTCRE